MERIKVFKGKEWLARFFVVFGIAYTLPRSGSTIALYRGVIPSMTETSHHHEYFTAERFHKYHNL